MYIDYRDFIPSSASAMASESIIPISTAEATLSLKSSRLLPTQCRVIALYAHSYGVLEMLGWIILSTNREGSSKYSRAKQPHPS